MRRGPRHEQAGRQQSLSVAYCQRPGDPPLLQHLDALPHQIPGLTTARYGDLPPLAPRCDYSLSWCPRIRPDNDPRSSRPLKADPSRSRPRRSRRHFAAPRGHGRQSEGSSQAAKMVVYKRRGGGHDRAPGRQPFRRLVRRRLHAARRRGPASLLAIAAPKRAGDIAHCPRSSNRASSVDPRNLAAVSAPGHQPAQIAFWEDARAAFTATNGNVDEQDDVTAPPLRGAELHKYLETHSYTRAQCRGTVIDAK